MTLTRPMARLLIKAQEAFSDGQTAAAIDLCNQCWAHDKSCKDNVLAVATCLVDGGQDEQALQVLSEALQVQGETEEICRVVGEMALRMSMPSVAEKTFSKAFEINSSEPSHIVNLCQALQLLERYEEAKDLLSGSLQMFPSYGRLWNALGMLMIDHFRDFNNGRIFLQEAMRLDPEEPSYPHNMALSYAGHPMAEEFYNAALEAESSSSQIQMSYALFLMAAGRTREAWPYYEARLDPELGHDKAVKYSHGIPVWQGEELTEKSILVCAEQGIGDEIFFSIFLPMIIKSAGKVTIGCDPRLVSLYQRSFPTCDVFGFEDVQTYRYRVRSFPKLEEQIRTGMVEIDCSLPIGSLPHRLNLSSHEIQATEGQFLIPDPERLAEMELKLSERERRLRVGVSWRSSNVKGVRKNYYQSANFVVELARKTVADFYVLQYVYSDEEYALLIGEPNIFFFSDVDLKQDIEANIALLSLMDVSVGPPTATQMFAMAAGTPLCLVNNGYPWTTFGDELKSPLYAKDSVFVHTRDGSLMKSDEQLSEEVSAYLKRLSARTKTAST